MSTVPAWADCECDKLGRVRECCKNGMFPPYDPLQCGLSIEKILKPIEYYNCSVCNRKMKKKAKAGLCFNCKRVETAKHAVISV
jgi:hypothetical protein